MAGSYGGRKVQTLDLNSDQLKSQPQPSFSPTAFFCELKSLLGGGGGGILPVLQTLQSQLMNFMAMES